MASVRSDWCPWHTDGTSPLRQFPCCTISSEAWNIPSETWNILQAWLRSRVQIPAGRCTLSCATLFLCCRPRCCPTQVTVASWHYLSPVPGAPRFPRHQPQKPSNLGSNTVEANVSTTNRGVPVGLIRWFSGTSSHAISELCSAWNSETEPHHPALSWGHSLQDYSNVDYYVSLMRLS